MPTQLPQDVVSQHTALTRGCGVIDVSDRSLIELTGKDRQSFLHNMCTNDIKRLTPGDGCEALFTNPQGKVLGHVFVFCQADSLVIDTVPGQSSALLAHLDRYLIREDVQLHDRSDQWSELLVSGTESPRVLESLMGDEPPQQPMSHSTTAIRGAEVRVCYSQFSGKHSYFIRCAATVLQSVMQALEAGGATKCGADAMDIARIETGSPLYGRDITERNLPQEVGRDDPAISFVKGCYIGQETVARIDALGHVNWLLVGVKFTGDEVPTSGTELSRDEKVVGHVTSAAFSPRLNTPIALAYVRRGSTEAGTALESSIGSSEVIKLPLDE